MFIIIYCCAAVRLHMRCTEVKKNKLKDARKAGAEKTGLQTKTKNL